jgi:signal recognition particle GTPase
MSSAIKWSKTMKTNKDERNAIATKFYNRMQEQIPTKQAELEKSSVYKQAEKLTKEINKLNQQRNDVKQKLEVLISNYNKKNTASYFRLQQYNSYGNENEGRLYIGMDSSWSVVPELCNAILIAQVGAETVEQLFEHLAKEVSL